jgi:hypothetical protein
MKELKTGEKKRWEIKETKKKKEKEDLMFTKKTFTKTFSQ